MSSPGGPGNGGWNGSGGPGANGGSGQYGQQQYYDPITGQPVPDGNAGGYSGAGPGQRFSGQPSQNQGMQYQGFGAFSGGQQQPPPGMISGYPPPEPPREGRGPLIAGIAAGAVVVIAIVTTVIVLSSGEGTTPPVAQEPAYRPAPPTSESSTPAPEPHVAAPQTPVVAGWQAVSVPKRKAVYDAPPDWTPQKPDSIVAFGEPEDAVTLSGAAVYKDAFCPEKSGSFRALSGATARKGGDDTTIALESAQKMAEVAYSENGQKPQIALGPPEQLRLHGGKMAATRVNATVTLPAPGPCGSPSILVSAIATNNDGDGSVVHITVADQGVPDAIAPEVVDQIGESFRPES